MTEAIVHGWFRDGWFTGNCGRAVVCPEALSLLRVVEALRGGEACVPGSP